MDTAPVICRMHVSMTSTSHGQIHVSIISTSHGQIHVLCLNFKTVIFIVVADLEISVSVCLYYYVWELWFGYRCCTRVRKQEAMELNTCEGLEIAEQCKILLIKLFTLLIQKFVVNFGTLSLQFLSELCSMYWATHALTISPLTLHQLLQFASKLIPWLWTAQFGHKVLSSDHWISKISQPDFYCNLSTLISNYLMAWDFVRL